MEEVIKTYPETIDTGGAVEAIINLLSIETDPRDVAVTLRGWNTNISLFRHTDWTVGPFNKQHNNIQL